MTTSAAHQISTTSVDATFKQRYNQTWIVERHGYKTPAQVRAEQRPPAALAA